MSFETKWQKRWRDAGLFRAVRRSDRPKWFIVELPPFANGSLHLGHVRNYVTADVVARFRRATGHDVLYSTGFDVFGLPNENTAREEGSSPAAVAARNMPVMTDQLRRLGLSHDPSRTLCDHEPSYYRWVQWVFLRLVEGGYAFRRRAPTNWCANCRATLSDSLVEHGRCWRCNKPVRRVYMEQWVIAEPELAKAVLRQDLPGWPEAIKRIHRDWIGLQDGFEGDFPVEGRDMTIRVFGPTRDAFADCIFVALSRLTPEAHATLGLCHSGAAGAPVDTGLKVVEPLTGRRLPLVVDPDDFASEVARIGRPQNALDRSLAERLGIRTGEETIQLAPRPEALRPTTRMRLRDWDIARPRYWGTPVPIVHCTSCGAVAVPDDMLPVLLPEDVDLGGPSNPLEQLAGFVDTPCPRCGRAARRDTETLETYSSPWWFYLICHDAASASPFSGRGVKDWMPVDLMVGGADQARTCFFHLRTMAEAMTSLSITDEPHPVRRLLAVGMVKSGGRKMSKSAGNGVDPTALVERYGADAVRWAVVTAAAPEQDLNWHEDLVVRAARFLSSVRRLFGRHSFVFAGLPSALVERDRQRRRLASWVAAAERQTIGCLERHAIHIAAQQVSFLFDQIVKLEREMEAAPTSDEEALAFGARAFLRLLAPFAPHLAEELWSEARGEGLLAAQSWPIRLETDREVAVGRSSAGARRRA